MSFENNKATYEAPIIDIYDFRVEDIMSPSVITGEDNDGSWNTDWNM